MPSPLRDSRGRQLPVVNTVTSNCSSAANSTVYPYEGSSAQDAANSGYYDRYRPRWSPSRTETESYYDRFRPHSVSSSHPRSELTATIATRPSISTSATYTSICSRPSSSSPTPAYKTASNGPASSNHTLARSFKTAPSTPASSRPISNENARATPNGTVSGFQTPHSKGSWIASATTLAASSPPKFKTGATFRQSPLTDTNVSRMTPGSINYDPLPPSQCPSKTDSVASTSTSLLYGLRWGTPAELPSSDNKPTSLAFPPKKAVNEWEERKRLMRAATSTPNFTTPSVATAKVAEKVTHKTSDKSPVVSAPKKIPVTPENPSTIKAVLRTKETTPTPAPKPSTKSKVKGPIKTKSHQRDASKANFNAIAQNNFSLPEQEPKDAVEKWQQISALRKSEEGKAEAERLKRSPAPSPPKSAPPNLSKSSPLKVTRAVSVSPPQDPPTRRSAQTAPATPPAPPAPSPRTRSIPTQTEKRTHSPSPTKPSGPRSPPTKKNPADEIQIPRFTLWFAGMSPRTYRNRLAAKREREEQLPSSSSPPKDVVKPRLLDVVVGASKVTQEERKWKQRDLGRKMEGLEEKIERLEKKKKETGQKREKIGQDVEGERERRRTGAW